MFTKIIDFNKIQIYTKRNINSFSFHYNRLFSIYFFVIGLLCERTKNDITEQTETTSLCNIVQDFGLALPHSLINRML